MPNPPTTLLVVLDGWGVSTGGDDDAIHRARTPTWDGLWESAPRTTLSASGSSVGLPDGQMGNSEVGHMNLGAGRTVYQDLTRIDRAIADGSFADNPVVNAAIAASAEHGGTLQVFGLLSPGGVHSHEDHLAAFAELSIERGARTRLHAFLDGRDVPPKSAMTTLESFEERFPGMVASITGRYFGMDRDARWDRTERAYRLVSTGDAPYRFATPTEALEAAYGRGETDEFVQPTAIRPADAPPLRIEAGDVGMFMNFRADRARQLVRALTADDFDEFVRPTKPAFALFATLTRYADDLELPVAFAPVDLTETVGECWAAAGLTQLRIAETEKYAHVTYFFSGGREQPFPGEDRLLVPSPKVATYDLAPAMSAREVTDRLGGCHRQRALRRHRLQLRQRRHGRTHGRLRCGGSRRRGRSTNAWRGSSKRSAERPPSVSSPLTTAMSSGSLIGRRTSPIPPIRRSRFRWSTPVRGTCAWSTGALSRMSRPLCSSSWTGGCRRQ